MGNCSDEGIPGRPSPQPSPKGRGGQIGVSKDMVVPQWLARAMCMTCLKLPPWSFVKIADLGKQARFWRMPGVTRMQAQAADGVMLDAAFVPGEGKREGAARLPVVFAHGVYQVRESNLWLIRHLVSHGFDVLALDMRAHGKSRGAATTFGVMEKHDISKVIDAAQNRGFIGEKFISMGLSLGAGCMLQHAAIDGRSAGVCAIAPFMDARNAVMTYRDKYFAYVTMERALESFAYAAQRAGFDMTEASPVQAVGKVKVPVLYLVGDKDNNLSQVRHTRPLLEATPEGLGSIELVPGATHFNIHKGYFPEFNRAVVEFCAKVSQEKGQGTR
jgi:uncharacterized protein